MSVSTRPLPSRRAQASRKGLSARQLGIVFVLSVLTVGVLAVVGYKAIRRPKAAFWPDRIAVIGLDASNKDVPVSFLGVVDPVRQTVVTLPSDAVVEVPRAGFIRAYHAWRLGGAPL